MIKNYFKPLCVDLLEKNKWEYELESIVPAHGLVIKPLLQMSANAYVYGLKKEDELYKLNSGILISDNGKFRFDTSKDYVLGHESLWNITTWKRGSIVIILKENEFDFSYIFKFTYRPSLIETPNMGNSTAALKKCKEESKLGNIAICFPASNGIEWMTIYANDKTFEKIVQQAEIHCQQGDYYKPKI